MAENLASCVRARGFYNGVARGLRDLFLNNSWFVGFNKIKTLKFAFCVWLRIWRGLKFRRGLLLITAWHKDKRRYKRYIKINF